MIECRPDPALQCFIPKEIAGCLFGENFTQVVLILIGEVTVFEHPKEVLVFFFTRQRPLCPIVLIRCVV